jgi:hypothetical protein
MFVSAPYDNLEVRPPLIVRDYVAQVTHVPHVFRVTRCPVPALVRVIMTAGTHAPVRQIAKLVNVEAMGARGQACAAQRCTSHRREPLAVMMEKT